VVIEGRVSSKLQITIPARVRDALGIQPGDTIRYELERGSVRLTVVRPEIDDVLDAVWAKHDLSDLADELGDNAVAYVQELRGWGEPDDQH